MAHNAKIVECPVVVFAGAGASEHLGFPAGGRFCTRLRAAIRGHLKSHAADEALPRAWESVCPARRQVQNFELIFERLKSLQDAPHVPGGENWRVAAATLFDWCQDELVRAYARSETRPDFHDLQRASAASWRALVESVHPGREHVLPVFTTNYDIGLDLAANLLRTDPTTSLQLPFLMDDINRHWRSERIDRLPRVGQANTALVLHLHGCVSWEKPERPSERDVAQLVYPRGGLPEGTSAAKALIWPAPSKRPFADPFWTHHSYLERCLEGAQLALFIGYGFWDEAVWAILRRAVSVNANLRLVVWDSDRKGEAVARLGDHVPDAKSRLLDGITDPFNARTIAEHAELLRGLAQGGPCAPQSAASELGATDLEPTDTPHAWHRTDGDWHATINELTTDWGCCVSRGPVPGDLVIEAAVECRKEEEDWAGIVFGWQDANQHWVVMKQLGRVCLKRPERSPEDIANDALRRVPGGQPIPQPEWSEPLGEVVAGCAHDQKHIIRVEVKADSQEITWSVLDSGGRLVGQPQTWNAGGLYRPGRVGLAVSQYVGQDTLFSGFRCRQVSLSSSSRGVSADIAAAP